MDVVVGIGIVEGNELYAISIEIEEDKFVCAAARTPACRHLGSTWHPAQGKPSPRHRGRTWRTLSEGNKGLARV